MSFCKFPFAKEISQALHELENICNGVNFFRQMCISNTNRFFKITFYKPNELNKTKTKFSEAQSGRSN